MKWKIEGPCERLRWALENIHSISLRELNRAEARHATRSIDAWAEVKDLCLKAGESPCADDVGGQK